MLLPESVHGRSQFFLGNGQRLQGLISQPRTVLR